MSIFALNITPYITSSIIMQLLTIAIPKLEEMQRDGEEGRKKIAEITRYLTVALALIEAIAMAISFKRGQMLQSDGILTIIMVIFTLTAGSAVLMWIGERITEKVLEMVSLSYLPLTSSPVFQMIWVHCISSSSQENPYRREFLRQ